MQFENIPQPAVHIQRLTPAIPAERLWLLVPSQPYGSGGTVPVHAHECPYFQQYRTLTTCVSRSGGSCCGGFSGTTADGYTKCGWFPRWTRSGQTFVMIPEDDPAPMPPRAGWN